MLLWIRGEGIALGVGSFKWVKRTEKRRCGRFEVVLVSSKLSRGARRCVCGYFEEWSTFIALCTNRPNQAGANDGKSTRGGTDAPDIVGRYQGLNWGAWEGWWGGWRPPEAARERPGRTCKS